MNWEFKMRYLCEHDVSPLVNRFVISWKADSSVNRGPQLREATTQIRCHSWETFVSLTELVTPIEVENPRGLLRSMHQCPRLSSVRLSQDHYNRGTLCTAYFEALAETLMGYEIGGSLKRLILPLSTVDPEWQVMYPDQFLSTLIRLKSQSLSELLLHIGDPLSRGPPGSNQKPVSSGRLATGRCFRCKISSCRQHL